MGLSLGGCRVVWSSQVVAKELWVEVAILGGVCLVEGVVVVIWVVLDLGWLWVPLCPWVVFTGEPGVIEGWVDCLDFFLSMVIVSMVWVVWSSEVEAKEVWVEVSEFGVVFLVKSVMVMVLATNAVLRAEILSSLEVRESRVARLLKGWEVMSMVAELVETVFDGPSEITVVVCVGDWVIVAYQSSWVEVSEGVATDILLKGVWLGKF